MEVSKYKLHKTFRCADGDGETLSVGYDNRGDPYSEGTCLEFSPGEGEGYRISVYLQKREVRELRDLLTRLLEAKS